MDWFSRYVLAWRLSNTKFTGMLLDHKVKISMDGKERFNDNIFVERLWRSLKYEEVYLKAYETVAEAKAGIASYMAFYSHERLHEALGYRTAREVHNGQHKQPWPNQLKHGLEWEQLDISQALTANYKTKRWNSELSLNLTP